MNFYSRTLPPYIFRAFPALLVMLMLMLVSAEPALTEEPIKVTAASSLNSAGQLSQQKRLPLLLMFSISECAFCSKLENQVLIPMLRSGEYTDKVIIRKIRMDHSEEIEDFDGKRITMKELTQRYRVAIYPTVLFVDHRGRELSSRLIGINSVEMYNWDVDVAIDDAYAKLNKASAETVDNQQARAHTSD